MITMNSSLSRQMRKDIGQRSEVEKEVRFRLLTVMPKRRPAFRCKSQTFRQLNKELKNKDNTVDNMIMGELSRIRESLNKILVGQMV